MLATNTGTVFVEGCLEIEQGDIVHKCFACVMVDCFVAHDFAVTWPIELLLKRNDLISCEARALFPFIPTVNTLRHLRPDLEEVSSLVFGCFVKEKPNFFKKGGACSVETLYARNIYEVGRRVMTTEIKGFALCAAVARLDLLSRSERLECDSGDRGEKGKRVDGFNEGDYTEKSVIGGFEKVGRRASGKHLHPTVNFYYRQKRNSTKEREQYRRAIEMGGLAAAAAWRLCASIFGLRRISCATNLGKCDIKSRKIEAIGSGTS